MDIAIRRGEPEDALFLTSISFGAKRHWNYTDAYLEAWHEQLTITGDYIRDNTVFIAQKKNTIIGYCSIVEATEENMEELGFSKPGFWLDHIYIRPAYIENGIGTQLIEKVNTYCQENEITSLFIEADPHADGFFEKMGSEYLGELKEEDLDDPLSLFEYKVPQKQEQEDEEEKALLDQMAKVAAQQEEAAMAASQNQEDEIITEQDKITDYQDEISSLQKQINSQDEVLPEQENEKEASQQAQEEMPKEAAEEIAEGEFSQIDQEETQEDISEKAEGKAAPEDEGIPVQGSIADEEIYGSTDNIYQSTENIYQSSDNIYQSIDSIYQSHTQAVDKEESAAQDKDLEEYEKEHKELETAEAESQAEVTEEKEELPEGNGSLLRQLEEANEALGEVQQLVQQAHETSQEQADSQENSETEEPLQLEASEGQNDSQEDNEAEESSQQEVSEEQDDPEEKNEPEESLQQGDSLQQTDAEYNDESGKAPEQEKDEEENQAGPRKWTLSTSGSEEDQKFDFNACNANYHVTEDPELLADSAVEGQENFYGSAKDEEADQEDGIFSLGKLSFKPIQEDTEKRRMRLDREVLEQKMRELDGEPDAESEDDAGDIQEKHVLEVDDLTYDSDEPISMEEEEKAAEEGMQAGEEELQQDFDQASDEKSDEHMEENEAVNEIVAESAAAYTVEAQAQPAEEDVETKETEEGSQVKSEKEKMIAGDMYIEWGDEIADDKKKARNLLREFNQTDVDDKKTVGRLLKELFGTVGEYVHIEPDFKCSYGYNIHIGDNFYAGFNCVILDNCPVKIGKNCILSPQVGIYTQSYPMEAEKRIAGYEYAQPVIIGDNVWIGGGSIINPGVKIGDNVVIAPGSVVVTDIPDNSFASGNPAKVINKIVN